MYAQSLALSRVEFEVVRGSTFIQVARSCTKVSQVLASLMRVADVQGVLRRHAVRVI